MPRQRIPARTQGMAHTRLPGPVMSVTSEMLRSQLDSASQSPPGEPRLGCTSDSHISAFARGRASYRVRRPGRTGRWRRPGSRSACPSCRRCCEVFIQPPELRAPKSSTAALGTCVPRKRRICAPRALSPGLTKPRSDVPNATSNQEAAYRSQHPHQT